MGGVFEVDGADADLVGAPGGEFRSIDAGDAEEGLEESEEENGHPVRLLHGGDEVCYSILVDGIRGLGEGDFGVFESFGFWADGGGRGRGEGARCRRGVCG